jgi:hypothetical protein
MIEIFIAGVALFFTLFFYSVIKFQHMNEVHAQRLDV